MKRTKEFFFRDQPHWQQTAGMSGCTQFAGQDRGNFDRKKQMQEQQRNDYLTQIKQKQQRKQDQKQQQRMFDQQQLLSHNHNAQKDVQRSKQNTNLQLQNQRKQKEANQKRQRLQEERRQLEILNLRKVKRAYKPTQIPQ